MIVGLGHICTSASDIVKRGAVVWGQVLESENPCATSYVWFHHGQKAKKRLFGQGNVFGQFLGEEKSFVRVPRFISFVPTIVPREELFFFERTDPPFSLIVWATIS